jgi:hypothetical protein
MKIGLHFVKFDVPGGVEALPATFASTAKAAEQAGAEWFTMADHFYQMDNLWPAESPMLEVYTSLGYLAGQTERIKLVVLVNGIIATRDCWLRRRPPWMCCRGDARCSGSAPPGMSVSTSAWECPIRRRPNASNA